MYIQLNEKNTHCNNSLKWNSFVWNVPITEKCVRQPKSSKCKLHRWHQRRNDQNIVQKCAITVTDETNNESSNAGSDSFSLAHSLSVTGFSNSRNYLCSLVPVKLIGKLSFTFRFKMAFVLCVRAHRKSLRSHIFASFLVCAQRHFAHSIIFSSWKRTLYSVHVS